MRIVLILFCIVFSLSSFSQTTISLTLQERLNDREAIAQDAGEIPVVIRGSEAEVINFLKQIEGEYQYSIGDVHSARLTRNQVVELAEQPFVSRIDGGITGVPLNDSMRIMNNVLPLHNATDGIDRPYKGKGVIVGILDSGLDYRHPDFFDDEGNNRVLAIWDQTISGNAPNGYTYGHECDSLSIAAGTCASIDTGLFIPHGTHVAAVAAGYDKDFGGEFTGMAPESYLVAVALDFDNFATSILDGSKYIFDLAKQKGMPCVINLSAGTYFTSHDGNDVFTDALEDILDEEAGRAFTHAAGNGGNFDLHLGYEVTPEPQFTYFQRRSDNNGQVSFFLYADSIDFQNVNFQFQADHRTTFLEAGRSPFFSVQDFAYPDNQVSIIRDTVYNTSAQSIGNIEMSLEIYEGTYGLFVNITSAIPNHHWRFTTEGSGTFDVYSWHQVGSSRMLRETALGNNFTESENYVSPDQTQNIVGLFNASTHVISVGNLSGTLQWDDLNNIQRTVSGTQGEIRGSSSKGPTRDGRTKPDISSPGHFTAAAYGLGRLDVLIAANNLQVAHSRMHYLANGTSNSAPSVAGGIALLFERYPDLTWRDVKETLIRNARRDEFTGPDENNTYGFGKFDAFTSFENVYKEGCTNPNAENYNEDATVDDGTCVILGCTNPESFNYNPEANSDDGTCLVPDDGENHFFQIVPNPLETQSTIIVGFPEEVDEFSIEIYSTTGQLLWSREFEQNIQQIALNRAELSLASQVCYVILRSDGRVVDTQPLVIQ